ncbi:MAG: glycosyltransferase family 39 protein [Caldilineaceae bacterium]|nr:glycosyltransferase family 39 protein [Caldilineaceae bacterium]
MKLRWWEWLLLVAGLAVMAAQLLVASPQKSAAFDEQYHLAAGYSYLRTGDARLATTHPPLMGLLAATALLGRDDVALPLDHPAWAAGDRFLFSDIFLWEANANPHGLLVAARRPIMAVGLLLAVAIFFWARRMVGVAGGWMALLLVIFDPNLLGNARVVTTDLGLSCFLLLALWQLWRWLEQRSWINLVLAGLCAGLALSAKYTGLFVAPAMLLVALIYPPANPGDTLVRRLGGLALMAAAALVMVWTLYGFAVGPVQLGELSVIAPAPFYWQQLYNTFFRIISLQGDRYDFFWGEAANHGWWYYFPVALAVKTPLPLLILAAWGLWIAPRRVGWRRSSVLWATPLLFLALGLSGVLTIGYRHILPAIPFLILSAAYAAPAGNPIRPAGQARRPAAVVVALLVLWHVAGSLRIFPHQESFFNELAGDWYHWSNLLVDSNLDWGQDLPALRTVMAERGINEVNLAYFGKAAPEAYGVAYRPLYGYLRFVEGPELSAYNPYTPEPGWYAISATSLRLGLHQADTVDLYAFFRPRRPDARAGYSIYLYHITYPAETVVVREVVAGEPLYRLPPEAVGAAPGSRGQIKWVLAPDVAVYPLGDGFAAASIPGFQPVGANFDNVMTLLGFVQDPPNPTPGALTQLTLYWQVGEQRMPTPAPARGAPLSAFVHLTAAGDAEAKAVQFDGWPTALRGLEPGDIIVQPVELELPADMPAGAYDLLVGLYSPQSWARLPVVDGGDAVKIGEWAVGNGQ